MKINYGLIIFTYGLRL